MFFSFVRDRALEIAIYHAYVLRINSCQFAFLLMYSDIIRGILFGCFYP